MCGKNEKIEKNRKKLQKTVDKPWKKWYDKQAFSREDLREAKRKKSKYFFEKTFKKVLTKEKECDILFELSSRRELREESDWTLKIKQRDKKRNPRFDGKKTIRRVFKKYFSNSNTEAKISEV